MTERSDRDDEIVSASIDGEATPAEEARVRSDPVLRARRDALEAASIAVGAPVPPAPDAAREQAISAALDAFEPAATTADPAVVVPLHRRRAGRWLAAAAVLVVAAAIGGLLLRGRDDTTATTAARQPAPEGAGAAASSASSSSSATGADSFGAAATAGAPANAPLSTLGDLGTFESVDALAVALRSSARNASDGAKVATTLPSPACPTPPGLASVDTVATATLAGQPVVVYVGTDPNGAAAFVVLDRSCATVAAQPL